MATTELVPGGCGCAKNYVRDSEGLSRSGGARGAEVLWVLSNGGSAGRKRYSSVMLVFFFKFYINIILSRRRKDDIC
jgi:hypothetical protein